MTSQKSSRELKTEANRAILKDLKDVSIHLSFPDPLDEEERKAYDAVELRLKQTGLKTSLGNRPDASVFYVKVHYDEPFLERWTVEAYLEEVATIPRNGHIVRANSWRYWFYVTVPVERVPTEFYNSKERSC